MSNVVRYAPYLLIILPALAFAAAGAGKLAGVPMLHESFATMGLPNWFGYLIGTAEVVGAIGLLLPQTRKSAASGLAFIMIGAIYYHVVYSVPSAVPAIVLLVLLILVLLRNWNNGEGETA